MHTCIHASIHTYSSMETRIHAYMHTCIYTRRTSLQKLLLILQNTLLIMHACTHTFIHSYIHTYIYTYIHTHIGSHKESGFLFSEIRYRSCVHAHTHTHTYIHTNTCIGLHKDSGFRFRKRGQRSHKSSVMAVLGCNGLRCVINIILSYRSHMATVWHP